MHGNTAIKQICIIPNNSEEMDKNDNTIYSVNFWCSI